MIFYIDAAIPLAVRTALDGLRDDVVYAGGPSPAPTEDTPDEDWLAVAGQHDWVVITRDKRIRTRQRERDALQAAGVRTFCATGSGNYSRWQMLHLLVSRWERIEHVARIVPGPYIYAVTYEGVRRLG